MTFTMDELNALYAPFPLNAHKIREGHKVGNKIRWFVYVDRPIVQERLERVFPLQWGIEPPITTAQPGGIAVAVGITIRGLTRWYNGSAETDAKDAMTDGFRRAASMWGVALYIYDMPIAIKTAEYPKGDWKVKQQMEDEAWGIFENWYRKEFEGASASTNSRPPMSPPKPQQNAPAANAEPNSANSKEPYEFVVTGFAFERSDKKQNYAFYTTEGDTVYAYGHDVLRQWGYNESHWSKWEQTPGKRVGMPDGFTVMAVYQDAGNSGYWLAESGKRVQS